jgi:hypothetical protein
MSSYQSNPVTVTRTAKNGDPGYDQNKDQVIIKMADSSEKTVLRTDVKN